MRTTEKVIDLRKEKKPELKRRKKKNNARTQEKIT